MGFAEPPNSVDGIGHGSFAGLLLDRHQPGDRCAMLGDRYGRALLDLFEQAGKVGFGFVCADFDG